MKTAEERWKQLRYMMGDALHVWLYYDANDRGGFAKFLAMVEADARADALAEKSVAPDADEERAKREYERFQSFFPSSRKVAFQEREAEARAAWIAYVKTLPPRPMRSPGQVLWDSQRAVGMFGNFHSYAELHENTKAMQEAAATALGIKPQE